MAQAGRDVARVTAEQRYAETGNVRVGATPDDTQQLVAEEMLRASTSGVFAMVGAGLAMRHNPNDVANLRQVVDQSVALGDMTGAYVGIRDSRATAQAQRGVVGSRASRPVGGSDVTFEAGGAFARAPWAPGMVAGVTPAQRTVGEPLRLVDPVSNVGTRMMARGIVANTVEGALRTEVRNGYTCT